MNSLYAGLARFELIAFFSGYPLLYSIVRAIAIPRSSRDNFRGRLLVISSFVYALLGTLYLGLQLKNLYPDYSIGHMGLVIRENYLRVWGVLAVLFWIPAISRRPILSLGHSLVIFSLVIFDLIMSFSGVSAVRDRTRNDMSMYTVSLLLVFSVYVLLGIVSLLHTRWLKDVHDKPHSLG